MSRLHFSVYLSTMECNHGNAALWRIRKLSSSMLSAVRMTLVFHRWDETLR